MEQNISGAAGSLTDADVQEFIKIYKEEFGETLDARDARIRAEEVMTLYMLLAHPLPNHAKGSIPRNSLDTFVDCVQKKRTEP